jgi:hypothetical protein
MTSPLDLFREHYCFFPSSLQQKLIPFPNAEAPSEDLLEVMRTFLRDYSKTLADMRESLSDSISEAWDNSNEAIELAMRPVDRFHIASIIRTENQQFNKVTMVFAVLCAEVSSLRQHAENKIYSPLAMFGQNAGHSSEPGADDASKKDANVEGNMGHFLPFLQEVANLITRCYRVAQNLVNQLACLFHERQKLYLSTFKHVSLDFVFEALGELGRVLLTLDGIIASNAAITDGKFHTPHTPPLFLLLSPSLIFILILSLLHLFF